LSWWQQVAGRTAVAPSLLAADAARLSEEVAAVAIAGADLLHLDVMDGHFVPNLTFGPHVTASLAQRTELLLDCHLMVTDPAPMAAAFVRAGAGAVSFHYEIDCDHAALADGLRADGVRAGLVLNPPTALVDEVRPLLPHFDFVLVMSVNPGFGGQSFRPEVLPKLSRLRDWRAQDGLDLALEIDGGIGPDTSAAAIEAGAEILVAGSAVFGSSDYAASIAAIRG
jgi:ribulose-phosphate 3-epimerase